MTSTGGGGRTRDLRALIAAFAVRRPKKLLRIRMAKVADQKPNLCIVGAKTGTIWCEFDRPRYVLRDRKARP